MNRLWSAGAATPRARAATAAARSLAATVGSREGLDMEPASNRAPRVAETPLRANTSRLLAMERGARANIKVSRP